MPKACWRRCTILTIDLSKIIINTFWPNANSNPPFNFNIVGIEMRNKINKIEASPTTNKFYGGSNYIILLCVCVCMFTVHSFILLSIIMIHDFWVSWAESRFQTTVIALDSSQMRFARSFLDKNIFSIVWSWVFTSYLWKYCWM